MSKFLDKIKEKLFEEDYDEEQIQEENGINDEEKIKQEDTKLIKMVTIGTISAIIIFIICGIFVFFGVMSAKKTNEVPLFVHQQVIEVQKWANDSKKEIKIKEVYSASPKGEVVSQQQVGEVIEITISKGQKEDETEIKDEEVEIDNDKQTSAIQDTKFKLPNFNTYTIEKAEKYLKDNGYKVLSYGQFSDKAEKGMVLSSDPASGRSPKEGSTVILYYSLGMPYIEDTTGKTKAEALEIYKNVIKDGHLNVSYQEEESKTVEKGKIISVSPADSIIEPYGTITIKLSLGYATDGRNFAGENLSTLQAWVKDYGLKLEYEEAHSSEPKGVVISNTPMDGKLLTGETIKAMVSLGSFEFPDFVGKDIEMVRNTINEIKKTQPDITLHIEEEYSTTYNKDIVASQKVNGNIIYLVVSKGPEDTSYTVSNMTGMSLEEAKKSTACDVMRCKFIFRGADYSLEKGKEVIESNDIGEFKKGEQINIYYVVGER